MTDIASLGLEIKSDSARKATLELREFTGAASASQRAAEKWGLTADSAGKSSEEFSRRVRRNIDALEFQRQQLTRSAAEQERFAAVRRAGVSAESAAGRAVLASVAALQAQRAAMAQNTDGTNASTVVSNAATAALGNVQGMLKSLAAAYSVAALASKAWHAGMNAANLPDQAEQVGVLSEQLQAYRFIAVQSGVSVEQLDTGLMRLTQSMGAANKGGEEQIRTFEKLGVKILDGNGNLRATADVLPEVAKGLLGVSSQTERNALMMELFGKSGGRMATMLDQLAQGNDAVVASARKAGAVVDEDVSQAWNRLDTALKTAAATSEVTFAKLGAPIATMALEAVDRLLKSINANLDRLKKEAATVEVRASQNDVAQLQDQIKAAQQRQAMMRPGSSGWNMEQSSIDALSKRVTDANARAAAAAQQQAIIAANEPAGSGRDVPPPPGVGSPVPKGQADAYDRIIKQAQAYIAQKNVEAQAVGLTADAAARLAHQQELLNRAAEANIRLSPAQIAQLNALAEAMAAADSKLKSAKFMDDAAKSTRDFIAAQEVEQRAVFMSREAAAALRYEQEFLNKAANDNIALTPEMVDALRQQAEAKASAAEKTAVLTDAMQFGKEVTRGFLQDIVQGMQQGKSVAESFGNAMLNMLNKIADKLLQMAVDDLFNAAFGGKGKGGLGNLFSLIFGGGGSASNGTAVAPPGTSMFEPSVWAKGGAFNRGNVIPFARGGIVTSPMIFPMSRGMGLMGEAGPEGVLPLRRGRNGRLGVEAGGGGAPVVVNVYNNGNGQARTEQSTGPGGAPQIDVFIDAADAGLARRLDRGTGPTARVLQGRYGLVAQGRR